MANEFQAIKDKLLREKKLFIDSDFPATAKSLSYSRQISDRVQWKRPKDISSNPRFIIDGAASHDITQGKLGDCWFLSATAVIATRKDLFDQVVPQGQTFGDDYAGIFKFRLWRYGEWKEVWVDDLLPTLNNKLMMCRAGDTDEFWPPLIEKAYAKLHGSYQALETGYPDEALVDLTGGIGEMLVFADYAPDGKEKYLSTSSKDKLFQTISRLSKRNTLLCSVIDSKDPSEYEKQLDNGLVVGHAYSITAVREFDNGGNETRLVRLRNPWGKKEWNGAWSDESPEWQSISDQMRDTFELVTEDDGEFWMTMEDWFRNFDSLSLCHLSPETVMAGTGKSNWNVVTHHGEWVQGVNSGGKDETQDVYWTNPQYFIRLRDADDNDKDQKASVVVALMQKYQRLEKTQTGSVDMKNEAIGFNIYKYKGNEAVELGVNTADKDVLDPASRWYMYEYRREVSARYHFPPGVYCIIPTTYSQEGQAPYMLRICTEKPVESRELDQGSVPIPQLSVGAEKKVERLFGKICGEDKAADARELMKMLNKGLFKDKEQEFSKETCRLLLRTEIKDDEKTATLEQCKVLYAKARLYRDIFDDHDTDCSGDLNVKELREAFLKLGFKFSRNTLRLIAKEYCDKRNNLDVDDLALVHLKTSRAYEKFSKQKDVKNFEKWIHGALQL